MHQHFFFGKNKKQWRICSLSDLIFFRTKYKIMLTSMTCRINVNAEMPTYKYHNTTFLIKPY